MEPVDTRLLTLKQKDELLGELLVNLLVFMKHIEDVFTKYGLFVEDNEEGGEKDAKNNQSDA